MVTYSDDLATAVAQILGLKGLVLGGQVRRVLPIKTGTVLPGHRWTGAAKPQPGSLLTVSGLLLGP